MKTSNTIFSVLGGVIVGAAIGILFAPEKGTDTRKKIAKKGNDAKNKAVESFDDLLDTLSTKCNSLMNKGEDLVNNSENMINKGIETAKKDFNSKKDQIKL